MNVRIEYATEFNSGVIWDDEFLMNTYVAKIEMLTQTTNNREQNVALERIKYIVAEKLQSGVFLHEQDRTRIKRLNAAGIRTLTLPENPVDQIIGMMLYCKLNAVMEDRMAVTQLSIRSEAGANIVYLHNINESIGPFTKLGWWHSAEPDCHVVDKERNKIVQLPETWKNIGLEFDAKQEPKEDNTVVVFKKDDQE